MNRTRLYADKALMEGDRIIHEELHIPKIKPEGGGAITWAFIMGIIGAILFFAITGCSLTTKNGTTYSIMQMQIKDDSASVYSDTATGFRAKIPVPFSQMSAFEVTLGYLRSARGVVPLKPDGTLPVVLIDTGVNPFQKEGVTDTFLLGERAIEEFYTEEAEDNPEEFEGMLSEIMRR